MTFGLSFTNNANVVILDSASARLCLIYSGTYDANSGGGYQSVVVFPSPITTQEEPFLFIRPATQPGMSKVGGYSMTGSSGNWTGFRGGMYNKVGHFSNGHYMVGSFAAASAATYGLRIFDSNSVPIFDSGTPNILFTRAFQAWTYQFSDRGDQGESRSYYSTSFDFPENEYILCNTFNAPLNSGGPVARSVYTWWDFQNKVLYAVTIAFANPYAFWLPALFAKVPV